MVSPSKTSDIGLKVYHAKNSVSVHPSKPYLHANKSNVSKNWKIPTYILNITLLSANLINLGLNIRGTKAGQAPHVQPLTITHSGYLE
jgi:hypothetical protein